jgi:two-component system NtrC family response regulator
VIDVEDLPDRVRDGGVTPRPASQTAGDTVNDVRDRIAEFERSTILAALEACRGNQTAAAKQLGVSRRTLIYRMEKHSLKPLPDSRKPAPEP